MKLSKTKNWGTTLVLCVISSGICAAPVVTDREAAETAPESVAPVENVSASIEQGQTPLEESFDLERRQWRLEKRRDAFRDTQFKFNVRTFYLNRHQFDGSKSEAWAAGGWAGLKTGYFIDHISFGATAYTSQRLEGDEDEDGTLLLAPGQEGYSVLGELYVDIKIVENLNLYVGRKEYDTPFINRNDTRMTPNTFEAIVIQGRSTFGEHGGKLKYGAGYFDAIKERNSDEFISMAEDAGASSDSGVYTLGVVYENGPFSVGGIDYYCPDLLNIAYMEASYKWSVSDTLKPKVAFQATDQRSVGDNLLQDDSFSVQQFGLKAELPVYQALFTAAFTHTTDDANMRSPWSGYPGYTSIQVQDFNRAGESAVLLRAGYDFKQIKGLGAYALAVLGTDPEAEDQYRQSEVDVNLQWAPPEGMLKGLSVRLRYAVVSQDGGDVDDLQDFRVICNYALQF